MSATVALRFVTAATSHPGNLQYVRQPQFRTSALGGTWNKTNTALNTSIHDPNAFNTDKSTIHPSTHPNTIPANSGAIVITSNGNSNKTNSRLRVSTPS